MRVFHGKPRTITIFAASLLTIISGSSLTTTPSFALSASGQLCDGTSICLNAWNGGPQVNEYTAGDVNDYFQLMQNGSGDWNLQFIDVTGTGWCVGDFGNSSTDARAGLTHGLCEGVLPWGANFTKITKGCPTGEFSLKNVHWTGGWLAPRASTLGIGDPFYLNNTVQFCYSFM